MNKILTKVEVENLFSNNTIQSSKRKKVLCHGVFDLVHPGHLEHFLQAKKFGDILIVSITADRFVNKGPNRPYFNQNRRALFLSSLDIVDFVYVVESGSAIEAIRAFRPDYYVKGKEYLEFENDITGKIVDEAKEVEKVGGKLVFTEGFSSSSTMLINSELSPYGSEISKWVKEFKRSFSKDDVLDWIDRLNEVNVRVIGEAIIDAYTECKPLAKSSKDPILAFQRFNTREYLGGVLAIAASISSWAKQVEVFTIMGPDFEKYLKRSVSDFSYGLEVTVVGDRPTILKHRFVDVSSGNRIFEYYDYEQDSIPPESAEEIWQNLCSSLETDSLLLVADYGHGLFLDSLVNEICNSEVFVAVNTQANAGNRGFNTFSKYSRIDFLCLNSGELELELRMKTLDYSRIVPAIARDKGCRNIVVTFGAEGMLVFDTSGDFCHTPALASTVIDKVGAGDSVLAMASLLSRLHAPKEIIGLLASIAAAFEVSQLGHKTSMSIIDLKKFTLGLLG